MGKLLNEIVTAEYIKTLIDGNELMPKFIASSYTKKCLTKESLKGLVYVDETTLSVLTDNQMVRSELVVPSFGTDLLSGNTYGSNGGSFNHRISSQYGYSSSDNASWFSTSPISNGAGIQDYTLNIQSKGTTGIRSGTLTFTESLTGKTINIVIKQSGIAEPDFTPIVLFSSLSESDICDSENDSIYYIESGSSYTNATQLFTNAAGTSKALAGYYRQGIGGWRYWNGTTGFTMEGDCFGG